MHRFDPFIYQYHRDWAACDWVASEKMRDIKRDTFMEKLGYHLFHFRSDYRRQCLRSRGYDFYEEEEEYYDEDDD